MNFLKMAVSAAALCLGLGAFDAAAADAPAPASIMGCIDMSKKVAEALDRAQQSANTAEARAETSVARDYCSRQMFREGVTHYAKAIKLLTAV